MQAGAALGPGISQQAFKKETGVGVGCVIPARTAPTGKIPIEGSGSGDEVRKVCVKRVGEFRPDLMLTHCTSVDTRAPPWPARTHCYQSWLAPTGCQQLPVRRPN